MDEQWAYQCSGVRIVRGMSHAATNGFLGVTRRGHVVLFNNSGEGFERSHAREVSVKSSMLGTTIRINGRRYKVEFHPYAKNVGMALGIVGLTVGVATGAWSQPTDPRSEREKRTQFVAVVTYFQQSRDTNRA